MGLDFSHCDAHWAYSGFMRFRTKLAAEVGIALHCMESFAWDHAQNKPCSDVEIYNYDSQKLNGRPVGLIGIQPVIEWSTVNDDIVPLLNHSDCDGVLTVEECKRVAPRLRELVANWEDDDFDKINALLLAEGMEEAILGGDELRFI